jgi:3-isopropylmalate/(R)-2-methylmalate dehydratase large subunit
MIDQGILKPGMTAIGTDSHYNILGAIGTFGQGTGDVDTAYAFHTGVMWFDVPPSVRINFKGMPSHPFVTPKDVILRLLQEFGASGLLGRLLNFTEIILTQLVLTGVLQLLQWEPRWGLYHSS